MTDPIVYPGEAFGVRYGVGPFKWRSLVRGVLRALQSPEDPCTPVDPEDPSILESMTPYIVYPSEDTQLYEERFEKLKEDKKKGIPLPPRGGTWLMDEVRDPTRVGGPFPYFGPLNRKILVTGGGTIGTSPDGAAYNSTYEAHDGYDQWTCPPRKFLIGRSNSDEHVEGWPWIEIKPDPEDEEKEIALIRLVKVSAVIRVFDDLHSVADFKIEFVRPTGEPFEVEDSARLDPIEFTVDHAVSWEDDFYGSILKRRILAPEWYDFSVTSLTKRGNKAILGIHSAVWSDYLGCPCDFVVLDLEAENEEEKVTFYDRFALNPEDDVTADYFTTSGSVGVMHLYSEGPEPSSYVGPDQYMRYRGTYQIHAANPPMPSGGSSADIRWGSVVIFLHFDAEERIIKTYLRYDINASGSNSNSMSTHTPHEATLWFPGVRSWSSASVFYPKNSIVLTAGVSSRDVVWYFRCTQAHTSTPQNGPGINITGTQAEGNLASTDTSSNWEFFFGRLRWNSFPQYAAYRSNWILDPEHEGCPPLDWYKQSGLRLEVGVGGDECIPFFSATLGERYSFSNAVTSSRSNNTSFRYSIRQDFLEDPPTSPNELYYMQGTESRSGSNQYRRSVSPWPTGYGQGDGLRLSHGGSSGSSGTNVSLSISDSEGLTRDYSCGNSGSIPNTIGCVGASFFLPVGAHMFNQSSHFFAQGARSFQAQMGYNYFGNEMGLAYIDGVGISFGIGGLCTGSGPGGGCGGGIGGSSDFVRSAYRGYTFTFVSGQVHSGGLTELPDANAYQLFRSKEDYDSVFDATDPGIFGNSENNGKLLQPVIGPEKGILCPEQQIAFIGGLYDSELRQSSEDEE